MINKKGQAWFLGIVGRTLIAVLGVALIGVFIYKMYELNSNQESENAKQVLASVIAKVNAVPINSNASFAFQGFSENPWFIVGWNGADRAKPNRCGLDDSKSCICICPDTPSAQICQTKGFCQIVPQPLVLVQTLPISYIASYATGAPGAVGGRGTMHRGCISLPSNLFELKVSSSSSSLTLDRDLGKVSLTQSNEDFQRLGNCPVRLSGEFSAPL